MSTPDEVDRAVRLRKMTDELLNSMSPSQRDRMMQTHLAQARGARLNALLMRQVTDTLLRLQAQRSPSEQTHDSGRHR